MNLSEWRDMGAAPFIVPARPRENEGISRPGGALTPPALADHHLGEIDMAIVPDAPSRVTTPPDLYPARMSRVDGCPECATNTEAPRSVDDDGDGFRAHYLCADCGHAWFTTWSDA